MSRYYPGQRAVYDWDRIDRVLRHMVPLGFNSKECSEAVGVPRLQTSRRASVLGIPFSKAFGPESKCRAGHKLAEVGYKTVTSDRSGRVSKRCCVCYKGHKEAANERRRAKRGAKKRPSKRPRKTVLASSDESSTQRSYDAAIATNIIIALHERLEAEPMEYRRKDIRAEIAEINELRKRVTA